MNLKKIRRIAVIRNQKVGDLIVALPVFEALRQGMPHAHITAVVSPMAAPLLNHHPHVDDILLDDYEGPPEPLTALLQAGRFDAVLVTVCTGRNCRAAMRAGVPIRVTDGLQPIAAQCGTHRCRRAPKRPFHEASIILAFVQRLGIRFTLEQARPYLYVDPAERTKMQQRIAARIGSQGPLLAVHPGSRNSAYNWPVGNYFQTIERLAAVGRVVITGSRYDQAALDWIESRLSPALRERVVPITDLTLPELVATLSLCDAVLASSTGPLHIAAIVSRSAVGLYSEMVHMQPSRWRPIGPNCSVIAATWNYPELFPVDSPLADLHMAQIPVDAVVERILESVSRRRVA